MLIRDGAHRGAASSKAIDIGKSAMDHCVVGGSLVSWDDSYHVEEYEEVLPDPYITEGSNGNEYNPSGELVNESDRYD